MIVFPHCFNNPVGLLLSLLPPLYPPPYSLNQPSGPYEGKVLDNDTEIASCQSRCKDINIQEQAIFNGATIPRNRPIIYRCLRQRWLRRLKPQISHWWSCVSCRRKSLPWHYTPPPASSHTQASPSAFPVHKPILTGKLLQRSNLAKFEQSAVPDITNKSGRASLKTPQIDWDKILSTLFLFEGANGVIFPP